MSQQWAQQGRRSGAVLLISRCVPAGHSQSRRCAISLPRSFGGLIFLDRVLGDIGYLVGKLDVSSVKNLQVVDLEYESGNAK
jgi:hypothetical protein